jgi:hypothetical protein
MLIHVAAVFSAGGVHFLAAAPTSEELMSQIGSYVEGQADLLLHGEDARRVRALLTAGECAEGVRLYFESVGERWEREYLRLDVVAAPA